MAVKRARKLAMLAKIEASYGTDANPVGANAMICRDVTLTPMEGQEVDRGLYQTHMGQQGVLLAAVHVSATFSVELTGSGAAGTAPGYGVLLRACGMSETIEEDVEVEYAPVSDAFESATLYFNLDGVLHIMLGARGNASFSLAKDSIPLIRFNMRGLLVPVADAAMPTQAFAGFAKPVIVDNANTTLALHGIAAAIAESVELDLGNEVVYRNLIGDEAVLIVDRLGSGSAVLEAKPMSVKNWVAVAQARTRGALALVHGTQAGNIVELACPATETGRPTYGETDKIRNLTLPLMLCPDEGNDELVITVK
ncbi:MAG: hypothetical protein KF765_12220 [Parvibaculaceae bacterium]|nr:hypothetical protein [Parvibaculaceae bacterium]